MQELKERGFWFRFAVRCARLVPGDRGSGQIVLNGAAAFQGKKGHLLTIMSFAHIGKRSIKRWKPRVIVLGKGNRIVSKRGI